MVKIRKKWCKNERESIFLNSKLLTTNLLTLKKLLHLKISQPAHNLREMKILSFPIASPWINKVKELLSIDGDLD